jgi:hypothetical protein
MTSERPSPAGGSPLLEPLEPRLLLGGAPVPTVHPPILSWAGTNGFISDGVEPDVGFADTSYDLQLKYTDPDNQPPADGYPRVHILADGVDIAGSPLPMSPRTTATISSGRIYGVSTPDLPRGPSYQYFFEAMDTAGNLATGTPCVSPRPGPQVLNCPPRVDWRTDASCVQNGLYPQIRCPGFFTFWAIYTDRDNDPPEGGSPKVHVLKGGAEIAGSPFDMIPSGSPALGGPCRYKATILLLPPGDDYSYYFSAKDSWGASAGGEATSLQAGPEVVCDTQYGLVSASYGVFPDKIQVFWFDWAGPAVYEVWRGQSQLRAEAYRISPSDLTCTSFEDTTAEVGKKYYYFLKTTRADGEVYWSNDLNAWGLRGPEPHVIMLPDPARCVTGVSASHASFTDKVRVTWSPQEGAVAYEVWVTPHNHSQYGRVDLPDSTTLAAEVTGTSYDDTNVVRGEDYVYRVLVRREGDPPSSNGDRPYGGGPPCGTRGLSRQPTRTRSPPSATRRSGHWPRAAPSGPWWEPLWPRRPTPTRC